MTDRELMEEALEFLEDDIDILEAEGYYTGYHQEIVEFLHERLAQPEREWVGLTDDEIYEYADKFLYQHGSNYGIKSFGKAIEAKLKEKNT
jgi:hypothetical protein